MVLVSGKCVMNESILTGESVPEIKSPIDQYSEEVYDLKNERSKKNTVFAGSKFL
jgi:magnesium-transporting ATPase (P-type)